MKFSTFLVSIAAYIYLNLNNAIFACSSCNAKFNFSKEKIDAYFDTTILMGVLPVSFIGLIVFVVYKQSKSANN